MPAFQIGPEGCGRLYRGWEECGEVRSRSEQHKGRPVIFCSARSHVIPPGGGVIGHWPPEFL